MEKRRKKTSSNLLIADGKKKREAITIINSLTEYLVAKGCQILSVESTQAKSHVSLHQSSSNYQFINTRDYKSSFIYLKEADIILVPNSRLIITWLNSLLKTQQKRVWFLTYHLNNNDKEQSEKNDKQINLQKRITFRLNADLVARAEDFLKERWENDNYTHSSLSELIRISLQSYQQGKLKIPRWRDKNAPKKEINVRLSGDLANFYLSLPRGRRINFVEGSLLVYLDSI